jgi:hypothetical protein
MLRPGWFACVGLIAACIGCAHHRNDYAYAPPYAPPVYPQPQPAAMPAAPTAPPAVVMPAGAVPAAAMPGPVSRRLRPRCRLERARRGGGGRPDAAVPSRPVTIRVGAKRI